MKLPSSSQSFFRNSPPNWFKLFLLHLFFAGFLAFFSLFVKRWGMLPGFHPWSSLQVLSTLPLNRVEFTQITFYPLVLFKSTVYQSFHLDVYPLLNVGCWSLPFLMYCYKFPLEDLPIFVLYIVVRCVHVCVCVYAHAFNGVGGCNWPYLIHNNFHKL